MHFPFVIQLIFLKNILSCWVAAAVSVINLISQYFKNYCFMLKFLSLPSSCGVNPYFAETSSANLPWRWQWKQQGFFFTAVLRLFFKYHFLLKSPQNQTKHPHNHMKVTLTPREHWEIGGRDKKKNIFTISGTKVSMHARILHWHSIFTLIN